METLNNCSPTLVGLRYVQFCATAIILVMQVCQCISGISGATTDHNNIEFGQLIDLRKILSFIFTFEQRSSRIQMKEICSYPPSVEFSYIVLQQRM